MKGFLKDMNSKMLLKECKKDIDKATRICKLAPSIETVTNELKLLNQHTELLDISKIDSMVENSELQLEYRKCNKIKKQTERNLVCIKKVQLDMESSIKELEILISKLRKSLIDIERLPIDNNISAMKVNLNQTILSMQKWIEEERKLIESLKVGTNTGVNLFKNYVSKIVEMQKERLK